MSTIAQQLEQAAAKATQASAQADQWANGPVNTYVPTDSGPVPTIAEFNRVTQARVDASIGAIGWVLAGDFTAGCTVTDRNQYVLVVGGSGYRWDGALPKVVAPGSAPTPIATGAWMLVDVASDAIGLAALPLPDVWAPLSDSLRLITGYGRDVRVGSDVVARMVNFSRNSTATYIDKDGQLKTAAANEPRFEKEGLLIEGQSQNLWPTSEGASQLGAAASTAVTASGFNLRAYSGTESAAKDVVVPQSTTLTVSAVFLVNGTPCKLAVQSRDGQGFTGWFGIDASGNVSVHPTVTFASVSSVRVGNVVRVAVTLPPLALTTTLRLYRWDATSVQGDTFGCIQVDPLPFASSYIPTAGAAVTRAADKAWLNVAGNLIPLSVIALEFNSIAPSSFYQAPNLTRYIVHTGDGTGITAYLGRFTTQFEDAGAAQGSTISQGRTVVVGGVSGGKAAIRSGAGLASGVAVKGFKQTEIYLCNSGSGPADRQVFGHVRNLRMYHRDLTADQYKAVA